MYEVMVVALSAVGGRLSLFEAASLLGQMLDVGGRRGG